MVRAALERLWTDSCDIHIWAERTDPDTCLTDFGEELLAAGLRCKLSYQTLSAADGDELPVIAQGAKLIIDPETDIPPGSKIVVTRRGKSFTFAKSGEAGVFTNHQEISLSLWRGWA